MKAVIAFLLIVIISMGSGGCGGGSSRNKYSTDTGNHGEVPTIDEGLVNGNLYVAAWLPGYQSSRALSSYLNNIKIFNEINPVWYNLNPNYFLDGAAPFIENAPNKATILSQARIHRIKVLPTIQNFGVVDFDPVIIGQILRSPGRRADHVAKIISMVVNEGYDGIDIDYENLPVSDKDTFSAFIIELATTLKAHRKLLSVTVYAKTSAKAAWSGPGAQDWPLIATYADFFKIMVYDYHWLTFHSGPIAPLDWMLDVLNYARSVPEVRQKLIIGLPLYGLDWGGTAPAKEVMYQDALNLMATNSYKNLSRNSVDHSNDLICGKYSNNVEMHFQYNLNGTSRTVYFQDRYSIRQRLKIINQYRDIVKGITFWRLGGEDPGTWTEVEKYK